MSGAEARRVLVVSGGPQLVEAARREWPNGQVRTCDSPSRRRLVRVIESFDPDVVVDGSPGEQRAVSWLQRRRGFTVPVVRFQPGDERAPAVADGVRPRGTWPVRREDLLFVSTDAANVAQQLGAVVAVGPLTDGRSLTAEQVRGVLGERIHQTVTLRRRFVDHGRFRRPGWTVVDKVELTDHVDEVVVSDDAAAARAVDAFWSERMDHDRPPWRMLVVRGLPGGVALVAMRVHHALADGLSAIGTLERLLDLGEPTRAGTASERPPARRPSVRLVARGLWHYAISGFAPPSRLNGRLESLERTVATASVPTARLRATAAGLGTRTSTLVVTAVTEALSRVSAGSGADHIRLMVPVSLRSIAEARTYGNWTATLTADVPITPMSPADRLRAVDEALAASGASGQPAGAAFALRALGFLPPPLHRVVSRVAYSSRFFNAVVSYVPGARERRLFAGASILAVYPVLGLAAGVRLAIGVMPWADTTGVCVLADRALAADAHAVADGVRAALDEYAALAYSRAEGGARREAG
ncbi:MAG: DUF1298 domain-containing protein [Acidothermales bacterium]|nr:DUF1298 domain-containing protein [Acidothermales bacterium]